MVKPIAPTSVSVSVAGPLPTDSTGQSTVAQAAGRSLVDAAYAQQQQAGNAWAAQPSGASSTPGNIGITNFDVTINNGDGKPQSRTASDLHATASFDFALPSDASRRNALGDQLGSVLQAGEQARLDGKALTGSTSVSSAIPTLSAQMNNAYDGVWNNLHPGGAAGPQTALAVTAAAQVFKNQALATGSANKQPANILNAAAQQLDDAVASLRPNAPSSVQRVWNRVNALYAAAGGTVPSAAGAAPSPTRAP